MVCDVKEKEGGVHWENIEGEQEREREAYVDG